MRADATPEQQEQDKRECRFEAVRAGAGVVHGNAFIQAAERSDSEDRVMRACMEARRYEVRRVSVPITR